MKSIKEKAVKKRLVCEMGQTDSEMTPCGTGPASCSVQSGWGHCSELCMGNCLQSG